MKTQGILRPIPRVIVRLQGGLGNQLFQYAAGRALADTMNQALGFDGRGLGDGAGKGDTPRPYLLDRLRVRAELLSPLAMICLRIPENRRLRRLFRSLGLVPGVCVQEREARYLPLPTDAARVYMDGYWQSWKYFEKDRLRLLTDLSPRKSPDGKNRVLLGKMASENTVCVHVRRGDYVSLSAANAFHGLMGLDYYTAAVKRLGFAARNAVYYVFSDEPAWARKNLKLPGRTVVVEHNGVLAPEEDLRLMAACRHFIIANSSLSWWGAWLGGHRLKKVVAPRRWFQGGPTTPDLCPPAWLRV